jgi:transposase-like protein
MSNQRYTPEFKDEAARQIVDRGYSVTDVSERLGVSAHLNKVARQLDERPRKTLGFRTPAQEFNECVASIV